MNALWREVQVGTYTDAFLGVNYISTTDIIAVGINNGGGGVLCWSNSSGRSWTRSVFQAQARPLLDVASFTTASAVTYILVTTDKGEIFSITYSSLRKCSLSTGVQCWTKVPLSGGYRLNAILIHESGNAFAVGANSIIYTSSNKTSTPFSAWNKRLFSSSSNAPTLNGIASYNGTWIIVVGTGGTALLSSNSGVSWTSISVAGTSANLYGISFGSAKVAMIVGVFS